MMRLLGLPAAVPANSALTVSQQTSSLWVLWLKADYRYIAQWDY